MASSRKTTSGGVRKATSRVPKGRSTVHETGKPQKAVRSGKGTSGRVHTTGTGLSKSSKPKATPKIGMQGKVTNASIKGKAGATAYPAGSNRGGTNSLSASGASGPKVASMSGAVNNTGRGYQSSMKKVVSAPKALSASGKKVINNTGSGYNSRSGTVARHASPKGSLKAGGSVHTTGGGYTSHTATVKRHKNTTSS